MKHSSPRRVVPPLLAALLASLTATVTLCAQTVFVDPVLVDQEDSVKMSGFELHGDGWFWWDNHPVCGSELGNPVTGKVGFKAHERTASRLLATSCFVNPSRSTPARDEAYSYYFARTHVGSNVFLYRKPLQQGTDLPGELFEPNGQTISLPSGEFSPLWVEGDHLFYHAQSFSITAGWRTFVYRIRRDGTANRETFAFWPGEHVITDMVPFTYLHSGVPFGSYRTGHMFLTDGHDLYVRDADGVVTHSRSDVYDVHVLENPLNPADFVYEIANFGDQNGALGRLSRINPVAGTATVLYGGLDIHFLELETAHWPNHATGRLFLHAAVPGPLGSHSGHRVWRQEVVNNFVSWEDNYLVSSFEGNLTGSREWVYYAHDGKIKGKRSDAPPELIDVQALGLEVTQGVQSLDRTAVLVAGKPTYARGYARLAQNTTSQERWQTVGRLHGTRNGSPLPGSPLSPVLVVHLGVSDTLPDQRNTDGGSLFRIPASWTAEGAATFEFRLNDDGGVPETGTAGNSSAVNLAFTGRQRTCLKFRPLLTDVAPYYGDRSGSGLPRILARAESMLPVSGFDVRFDNRLLRKPVYSVEWHWVPCPPPHFVCPVFTVNVTYEPFNMESDNDRDWAIFWLGVRVFLESDPCEDYHLVGAVHGDFDGFNGKSGPAGLNLQHLWDEFPDVPIPDTDWSDVLCVRMELADQFTPWNGPLGGRTLAHELGHNYGRRHVAQTPATCGGTTPEGPLQTPPFNTCSFGPGSGSAAAGAVAGFDVVRERVVPNDQNATGDLMSYASTRWTSVWTWNAIANEIPRGASPAQAPPAPGQAPGEWILVKGFYDTGTGEAFLLPSEIVRDGVLNPAAVQRSVIAEGEMPLESPFDICQLDRDGVVLSQHKAVPMPNPKPDNGSAPQLWFLQTIPCEPGMAAITLCRDEAPVAMLPRSPNPPFVAWNAPVPLEGPPLKLYRLSWNAFDADGTPLLFTVQYSPDAGATWHALASELNTPSLDVSLQNFPGGSNARLRVIACDGMDTATAEVSLNVPKGVPRVMIEDLAEGAAIPFGQTVHPQILAHDDEDGRLDPEWTLTGLTSISGGGSSPVLDAMTPGAYRFTATGTDRDGNAVSAQRNFEVRPVEVRDGPAPVLDGHCADPGWEDATEISMLLGGRLITTRLLHAGENLYVSVCGMPYSILVSTRSVGLSVDTDGNASPGAGPGPDARGFWVDEDGIPWQTSGNGNTMLEASEPPLGFLTAVQGGDDSWSAEFCIDASLVGGWDHAARIRLEFGHNFGSSHWPAGIDPDAPATWAAAWFGTLPAPPNQAPTAVAPEHIVATASELPLITLDGSASVDPENDELTFTWTQIGGPPFVTLNGANTATATFAPPAVGTVTTLTFRLVAHDGSGPSAPATTTVVLLPDPDPYVAPGPDGAPLVLKDVDYTTADDRVVLRFLGQPGVRHNLERSGNGTTWQFVRSATAGPGGEFQFTEPRAETAAVLYRARKP